MMKKILLWNIRSVNTQQYFERLTNLNKRNQYCIIGLVEPFQDPSSLDRNRRILGVSNAIINYSGKILLFSNNEVQVDLIMDTS